jgi:two-component system sensor histidine kinase PhoQ
MWSLSKRLTLAAVLVLAGVLSLTGWVLDRAFRQAAVTAVEERLQAQVYALLAAADLDSGERLVLPEMLPDARYSTPGSGLYAQVVDAGGQTVWRSRSMLGREMGFPMSGVPGEMLFDEAIDSLSDAAFTTSFAVTWETAGGDERRFLFNVAESKDAYLGQVSAFRHNLSGWLLAAVAVLAAVLALILRWGLTPLRKVAEEVRAIEQGAQSELRESYPRELQPLTANLNAFIRHEQSHLERYRRALADLAHALKTPLAVLGSAVDDDDAQTLKKTVTEQVNRMNDTVEYQLRRAAASGRTIMATPVDVEPVLVRLRASLSKVYSERGVNAFINAAPNSMFVGEEGDFMEIMGNLMDNAYKWARQVVRISTLMENGASGPPSLTLVVEDDGPGIPEFLRTRIAERGIRADGRVPGQGIGLAVVRELVEDVYGGHLYIEASALGGAKVAAAIPV